MNSKILSFPSPIERAARDLANDLANSAGFEASPFRDDFCIEVTRMVDKVKSAIDNPISLQLDFAPERFDSYAFREYQDHLRIELIGLVVNAAYRVAEARRQARDAGLTVADLK
ncbi:MAG: hypothetical protein ABW110_21415 [Steroidobacteraceae bacterium]